VALTLVRVRSTYRHVGTLTVPAHGHAVTLYCYYHSYWSGRCSWKRWTS